MIPAVLNASSLNRHGTSAAPFSSMSASILAAASFTAVLLPSVSTQATDTGTLCQAALR